MVATTLVDATVNPEAFAPERLTDARIHALAARVTVTQDTNPDVNALWPQRFVITLKDGWVCDQVIEHAIGHPDNPLDRTTHLTKFRTCWQLAKFLPERGDALIAMVDQLESVVDCRELAQMLVR